MHPIRCAAAAAAIILFMGSAGAASAATIVATTADAGGTVSVTLGDTLMVKMPGRWTLAGDPTPELVLDGTATKGQGARGQTVFTFSADVAGTASLAVQNAITKSKLSMLVDVMTPSQ